MTLGFLTARFPEMPLSEVAECTAASVLDSLEIASSAYGPMVAALEQAGHHVCWRARIVGGWSRGTGDFESFGIVVDLPTLDELRASDEAGRWDLT